MTVSSTTAATSTSTGTDATTSVLTQVASNFQDFLSLLTTQLQNQDPTAPMDTNTFTSELVQFTSVSEQVATNTTLNSLLTATLGQQLTSASSLVGQQATVSGGTLPLQNGKAQVNYQTAAAEPVTVTVSDSSGKQVYTQTVQATAGSNSWTWNGTNSSGTQLKDGAYTVAVTANSGGTTVPAQAIGTVTGAQQSNSAVQLLFGTTSVPYSDLYSVAGAASTSST